MTDLDIVQGYKQFHPVYYNALTIHRTHKNKRLDFKNNPWAESIYLDNHPYQVFIKSTQNGVTEYVVVREIAEARSGRNVFHVLPNDQILQRYVHERFDKSVRYTLDYQRELKIDSVHMKQIGPGTIGYVASGSASQFAEFPADTAIIDELDHCVQEHVVMAQERLSYSDSPQQVKIANPTIEGFGIDEEFSKTDRLHWHIKCECGAKTHPDFFKHVVRQVDQGKFMVIDENWSPGQPASMICDKCGRAWAKTAAGIWIPRNPGAARRGRHLSKLFTAKTTISELIDHFIDAESDDTKMTRFYNADLGLAYTAPGAKITEAMLNECVRDHKQGHRPADGVTIAGIDVGSRFHVTVGHVQFGTPGVSLIDAQDVKDPEEVDDILAKYNVKCFVIDAMPETRISRLIASKRPGGFICFFAKGKRDQLNKNIVTTDRTQAIDTVKAAVSTQALRLPINARSIPDLYAHITASTRVFNEDAAGGEGSFDWVEGSKPDHYLLSLTYMTLAARLLSLA